jgi:hypothetical protein
LDPNAGKCSLLETLRRLVFEGRASDHGDELLGAHELSPAVGAILEVRACSF